MICSDARIDVNIAVSVLISTAIFCARTPGCPHKLTNGPPGTLTVRSGPCSTPMGCTCPAFRVHERINLSALADAHVALSLRAHNFASRRCDPQGMNGFHGLPCGCTALSTSHRVRVCKLCHLLPSVFDRALATERLHSTRNVT